MTQENVPARASGGITFTGLLTIVFIALKLTGVIAWPWLWVLSPLWLPFAFFFVLAVVIVVFGVVPFAIVKAIKETKRKR